MKKDLSQQEFIASSSCFYNHSNTEQCQKYADLFMESIDTIKTSYHRDYAQVFFRNLSPAFLGQQKHLDKFRALEAMVRETRADDTHFLKLLSNEIEDMEMTISIKQKWQ